MPEQRRPWTAWTNRLRNSRRSAPRVGRHLRLENLEPRVVLSSLPAAVLPLDQGVDACLPVESTSVPQVAVADTALPFVDSATAHDNAYQSSDGVVHVMPPDDGTAVVVRQFIDYRLRNVVEVELEGTWLGFPADSVSEIQVQTRPGVLPIDVAEGVTVPVRLIEPRAMDDLFGQESVATVILDALDPITPAATDATSSMLTASVSGPIDTGSAVNSPPEGEGLVGGASAPLLPPSIDDFAGSRDLDCWLFTGQVMDDQDVTGLVINFGGVLAGHTAVVNEDGFFRLIVELAPDVRGVATARTVDSDGLESNTATFQIF